VFYACEQGHLKIVKFLWDQGLTVDNLRSDNNLAIRHASRNGHLDVVKFLYSQDLNLDDLKQ
jgi:ankyrin repeat protein